MSGLRVFERVSWQKLPSRDRGKIGFNRPYWRFAIALRFRNADQRMSSFVPADVQIAEPFEICRVWSRLPAFRAVAETEHLPTASRRVGVSPSSLSRTIRELEREVGTSLFERVGRRLVLNDAGARLLAHLHAAVRQVDAALGAMAPEVAPARVRVAASPIIAQLYWLAAAQGSRALLPCATLEFRDAQSVDDAEFIGRDVDVVFAHRGLHGARVTSRFLGALTQSVYVGHRHPMWGVTVVSLEQLTEHGFVGHDDDGWPTQTSRRVLCRTAMLDVIVPAVMSGLSLAVLPDALGRQLGLYRVPLDLAGHLPVYAAWSASSPDSGPVKELVTAMQTLFVDGAASSQ